MGSRTFRDFILRSEMMRDIAGLHNKVKNYSRFDEDILRWYTQTTIKLSHF
jgi:hypothetical protein